ncbi:glutathione S-transferase family protein [Glaciecola sp. MH2013]|uniref:glutathione S-transferase family protein n=1 Tax=Glaciecola sp. MH2013 TaxID=2785524 RepID=UPI0018A114A4|nr:glutathione S-transferase [Glaciecola sp. MH2013]MBF7073569.1 glutathione S-transferase family protein [Glaciecola sp. MH2013]
MLKLYGFDVSNYYNMLKLAMDLKGIDYEAVLTYPNQSPEYLAVCPTGKVPALQTSDGILIETNVIMEYLDSLNQQHPLYPGSSYEQARIKELVKMIELYIELPARRCHTEAFWGVPVHEVTKKEVKRALYIGMQALSRAASFGPYIAGDKLTAADIFFLYSADLASSVAKKLFDVDLLDEAPGAKDLMNKLNAMPEVQKVAAERKAAQPAFSEYLAKAFGKK